jgi:hypothetical protein
VAGLATEGAGTGGSTGSRGRRRRPKQSTPQGGGGSAPGGSVILDVTALLELADVAALLKKAGEKAN